MTLSSHCGGTLLLPPNVPKPTMILPLLHGASVDQGTMETHQGSLHGSKELAGLPKIYVWTDGNSHTEIVCPFLRHLGTDFSSGNLSPAPCSCQHENPRLDQCQQPQPQGRHFFNKGTNTVRPSHVMLSDFLMRPSLAPTSLQEAIQNP